MSALSDLQAQQRAQGFSAQANATKLQADASQYQADAAGSANPGGSAPGSAAAAPNTPAKPPDNTLTLTVRGQKFAGWQKVSVSRGLDRMPSDFTLEVTEREPGQQLAIFPFDPCTVSIGADLVITGYVDRYQGEIGVGQHSVTITGRSKCEDLVDCAAVYPTAQVNAANALQLAQDLAKAYGITVSGETGEGSIPPFNINLGETSWEIIERVSRYVKLLAYDDPSGNLVLAALGTTKHASGFAQGQNVQTASVTFAGDQQFSEYDSAYMSVDRLQELSGGNFIAKVTDESVPRFRRRVIISEQTQNGVLVAQSRAEWEKLRRYGRSKTVTITCDSWRDSAGRLWTPNMLAPVDIPALKINQMTWLVSEVTYSRDAKSGETAQVVLMPPEAFTVEPVVLAPLSADVSRAIDEANIGSGGSAGTGNVRANEQTGGI